MKTDHECTFTAHGLFLGVLGQRTEVVGGLSAQHIFMLQIEHLSVMVLNDTMQIELCHEDR